MRRSKAPAMLVMAFVFIAGLYYNLHAQVEGTAKKSSAQFTPAAADTRQARAAAQQVKPLPTVPPKPPPPPPPPPPPQPHQAVVAHRAVADATPAAKPKVTPPSTSKIPTKAPTQAHATVPPAHSGKGFSLGPGKQDGDVFWLTCAEQWRTCTLLGPHTSAACACVYALPRILAERACVHVSKKAERRTQIKEAEALTHKTSMHHQPPPTPCTTIQICAYVRQPVRIVHHAQLSRTTHHAPRTTHHASKRRCAHDIEVSARRATVSVLP